MNRPLLFVVTLSSLAIVAACPAQEDPFGGPAAAPAAAPPASAAAKKGGKAVAVEEAAERPPLVIELLRSSNATTPPELLQAAQIAFQFGRPDEAKVYLGKLAASKPSDDALAPLATQADFLLQLNAAESLQPEGRQVAALIFAASQRVGQNSEALATAVTQLSSVNAAERQLAIRKLSAAGQAALNPLLEALADKNRASEHPQVRSALVALAAIAELPLIAVLHDPGLQQQAIAVLARIGSTRALPHLIPLAFAADSPPPVRELAMAAVQKISGGVPDNAAPDRYLRERIERYLNGDLDRPISANDTASVWTWDEAKQQIEATELPRQAAASFLANQIARELHRLMPNDLSARRLRLLTELDVAKLTIGVDRELGAADRITRQVNATAGDVSFVLADAMRRGRIPAAIAAAELLGQQGDASVLLVHGGKGSPLTHALKHSDRRVRLAAALSAVKLDPGGSFHGAGLVAPTLARFIKTSGRPSVLVGHPRGEEAQALNAFLGPLGYEGEAAYTGRYVAERAFSSPDFEFLLLSDAIDGPPLEELVQWLRRDYRTARIPIGIMARSERLDALNEFFKHDSPTAVFSRVYSADVAAIVIRRLETIAGQSRMGPDERLWHATQALAALNVLAARDSTLASYDLYAQESAIIMALQHPAHSSDAAKLLGRLGTPTAQAALLDFASQPDHPLTQRQAAASAFAAAVKERGLRLTQTQVLQQFDRYNASASLDRPTQTLLAGILDTIETPGTKSSP